MKYEHATIEPDNNPNLATKVNLVNHEEQLSTIFDPDVAGVVLRQEIPDSFQHWIDTLESKTLPSLRKIVPVEHLCDTLEATSREAGLFLGDECKYLIGDATRLARICANMLKVSHLRVRFDVVRDNACRKFHLDQVRARLVCTYRGPGTQYGRWRQDADPAQIFDVPTGAPILLRGALWEEGLPSGIVHRSPPISGSNQTRLVLVLDPIDDSNLDH